MERWSSVAIIKEHLPRFFFAVGGFLEVADLAAEPSSPPFLWIEPERVLFWHSKKKPKKVFPAKDMMAFLFKGRKNKSDILAKTCCWGSHTGHPHFEPMVIAWMIRETQFLFGSYNLHVSYFLLTWSFLWAFWGPEKKTTLLDKWLFKLNCEWKLGC